MSEGIIGFGAFFIRRTGRLRRPGGSRPAPGLDPGQPKAPAEAGSRPSQIAVAAGASQDLGGLPDFSRPVTRSRAS